MEAAGSGTWYHFSLTCCNFAWEDCYDPMACLLADQAYRTLRGKKRWDENVTFTIIDYLCRCRKFWECPEGVTREDAWYQVDREIKERGFTRDVPDWALDQHTYTGWQRHNQGIPFPDRFSGTEAGRRKMIKAYQEYGRLDPDDPVVE